MIPREKSKTVKELKGEAQKSSEIYLATDPDREGEAIAWHLVEAHRPGRPPGQRVEFHEITKSAVLAAMKNPRAIDESAWTRSRRGVSWTGWWATRSARSCGRRCAAGCRPGACSRWPCG